MSPKEEEESPEMKKAKHLLALLDGGHWDELARLAKEDRDKKAEEEDGECTYCLGGGCEACSAQALREEEEE